MVKMAGKDIQLTDDSNDVFISKGSVDHSQQTHQTVWDAVVLASVMEVLMCNNNLCQFFLF